MITNNIKQPTYHAVIINSLQLYEFIKKEVTEEDGEDIAQRLLKYGVTLEQYEAAYELADVTMYVTGLCKPAYVTFNIYVIGNPTGKQWQLKGNLVHLTLLLPKELYLMNRHFSGFPLLHAQSTAAQHFHKHYTFRIVFI